MPDLPPKQTVNVLKIRDQANSYWLNNFCMDSWRVRNADNTGWITLTPDNTKVRNASDSGWLELGCPDLGDPFWHYLVDPPDPPVIPPTTTPAPTPTTTPATTPATTTPSPTGTTAPPTTTPPTTAPPTTTPAPTTTVNPYPMMLGEFYLYCDPVTSATLPGYQQEAEAIAAACRSNSTTCLNSWRLWDMDTPPGDPDDWDVAYQFEIGDNIEWRIDGGRVTITGSTSIIVKHRHANAWGEHYVSCGAAWARNATPGVEFLRLEIWQTGPC